MSKSKSLINWQLFLGMLLVLTGVVFLIDLFLPSVKIMAFGWPIIVILFGLIFIIGMLIAGRKGAWLAIPGVLITSIGVLLFIQNTFNLWVTWIYAWALLISALGLGLLLMNITLKNPGLRKAAGVLIGFGLILFVILGIFFEMILDISGENTASVVFLSVGLVLLGFFIIFSRFLFAKRGKQQEKTKKLVVDIPHGAVADISKEDQTSSGPTIGLEEFTRLRIHSLGEVTLQQGDGCSFKVEGEQALVEKISSDVNQGVLSIIMNYEGAPNGADFHWWDDEKMIWTTVTVKALTHLDLGGAVNLQAKNLQGSHLQIAQSEAAALTIKGLAYERLEVNHHSSGLIHLEGEVQHLIVKLHGAGGFDGGNLRSQDADLSLSGAGSASVWVEKTLKVNLSGPGDLTYRGDPVLEVIHTGSGRLIAQKPLEK